MLSESNAQLQVKALFCLRCEWLGDHSSEAVSWCCEGLAQYAAQQIRGVVWNCTGSDTKHVRLQTEKVALEALIMQQTHAIEVLKEEAAALRRDLAFVGQHININVAPLNPALEALQPLPALEQEPAPVSAPVAEGSSTSAVGAGLATEVGCLLSCRRSLNPWLLLRAACQGCR